MWLAQFQHFKAFSEAGMGKVPVLVVGWGVCSDLLWEQIQHQPHVPPVLRLLLSP